MFPVLRFELIDAKKHRCTPIDSQLFKQYPLNVCDTIETTKSIIGQSFQKPVEHICLWDKSSSQFIGMKLLNCSAYTLDDACNYIVDNLFDSAKKTNISIPKYDDEADSDEKDSESEDVIDDQTSFGSFGAFGDGTFGDQEMIFSDSQSNFLQDNFMYDSTTTISSFLPVSNDPKKTHTIQILFLEESAFESCNEAQIKGCVNKYWGRATKRSKVQNLKKEIIKYFDVKQSIDKMALELSDFSVKERISVLDYRSRKHQTQHKSHKRLSKYGEDVFDKLQLTRQVPFASLKIESLDLHQFKMYVGDDTKLGVDDVDIFMKQTMRVNGLSLRMVNESDADESYVQFDYRPEYSEVTCSDEKTLFDSTVNKSDKYDCLNICNEVTNKTINQCDNVYALFYSLLDDDTRFESVDSSELTKLTLKWKMYIPVSRVQDAIDNKLISPLFKKVSLNTSQKKNKYISQNFLKYEFDPCIWSKMGNNLSTKISCTIRTTSSNSVIVTVQSNVMKRKIVQGKNRDCIDLYLTLWVYDILRTIVLNKLTSKTKTPQLSSNLRLKDIDPYLFGESVRNGGYTRKCLNFKDGRIGNRLRYRTPMVINIECEEDMNMYRSLKYPGPIVKYRNNYYVGMRDELENYDEIESFNKKSGHDKEKIEYFNTIIFFEIHEEYYRAPNAKSGLIYPACVQRKDKLSKRHIDLMRQAYLETDEDRRIEIVEDSVGAKELINQLNKHEFNTNSDVGYIMQASRTLPINSFGRLPSDGSGVYEWFRQNSPDFVKGKREFLRKGVMHLDEYNLVHAIFDCLDFKQYRQLKTKKRVELVTDYCKKWSKCCSFGLFRTLQDGTLAQRMDYSTFINELVSPSSQLLHTEFVDLISYCLSLNIIIFDCDTYSHSKTPSTTNEGKGTIEQKKGYIASSAKIYYTTLSHKDYVFLLKMRGTYEMIVWYNGIDSVSVFNQKDQIVKNVLQLDSIHSSTGTLSTQLNKIHNEFNIVGQILNANNQCTHVILAISEVCVPVDGLCIPFKNDDLKHIPIVRYAKHRVLETIGVMSYIAMKFPEYTPESVVFDRKYSKPGEYMDTVYAIRLQNGLFCDVEEVNLSEVRLPDTIEVENNMNLRIPYYPEAVNAIILGITENDERCYFMKTLNNVKSTFDKLREVWHASVSTSENDSVKKYIYESYKLPNQERRSFMNSFVSQMWNRTIVMNAIHPFYISIMNTHSRELKFVLLNYFFRNPKFFLNPFVVDEKRKNGSTVSETSSDVLKFGNIDPLRDYLKDCTKRQISHLHVTVRKQRRITYIPPTVPFVQLDINLSESEIAQVKNTTTFERIGSILDVILNPEYLKGKDIYQQKIIQWLDTFQVTRPVIGTNDITFHDLMMRDDDAAICLALSVIQNRTIEVIDVVNETKCIYGSTLSYSESDRRIIYYLDNNRFGKVLK